MTDYQVPHIHLYFLYSRFLTLDPVRSPFSNPSTSYWSFSLTLHQSLRPLLGRSLVCLLTR